MRTEWRERSSSRRAAPGGHLFPGIAVADELVRRDRGGPRRLRGDAARPRVAARASRRLPARAPAHPAPQRGGRSPASSRASWPCPSGLLRAAALVRRLRPEAVLGVGRLRGRAGRARGRAPGSAHGDPRAEREARVHEPRPAALRATAPPAATSETRRRSARRACSPATRCAVASPSLPRKEHAAASDAPRLRGQPGLARPQ